MDTATDIKQLELATETLRAIAHPIRIGIIQLLAAGGQRSVTEIYEHLGIEQAVASHHLRIMKARSVVDVVRDGKNSNYFLAHPAYHDIVTTLLGVI